MNNVEGPVKEIQVEKVRNTMNGRKSSKAPGPLKLVLICLEQAARNAKNRP